MDRANLFVMEGENMAFATELAADGKDLPKGLFLDIMIEKTQMLILSSKTPRPQTGFSSKHW